MGKNLLSFLLYILYLRKPQSQTDLMERALIAKHAKNRTICVEIGVFEGLNTCIIAKEMNSGGTLYGIDPFFKGKLGISYPKVVARINLWRNKVHSKVELIEKYSYDACDDVPDEIDFIFIDGDHSYEGLKSDWEKWTPKVKSGGIVALHDTVERNDNRYKNELGSIRFYREIISKCEDFEVVDCAYTLNVLQKR